MTTPHLFQQISPCSHLVSGGKATVPRMFVNNASGQRGLGCLYDVVCFDEVSGVSFDQKDGVNILKGYMKGASVVLMPVSARKQLFDLSDDMATKVNVVFYGNVREALIKDIAD